MLSTVNDKKGMINLSSNDKFKNEIQKCISSSNKFYKKFLNYIDINLTNIHKNTIIPSQEKVHWTEDYRWIRDIYSVE